MLNINRKISDKLCFKWQLNHKTLLVETGVVNELLQIIQQQRKKLKIGYADEINVALVQKCSDYLTTCIYVFIDEIIEYCQIAYFYPVPFESEPIPCDFEWETRRTNKIRHFDHFIFDLYVEKHEDKKPKLRENQYYISEKTLKIKRQTRTVQNKNLFTSLEKVLEYPL